MARKGRRARPKIGKRFPTPGTAPGTLRPLEMPGAGPVRITVIDYGPDHLDEKVVERVEELLPYRDAPTITWINIEGLHDLGLIESLGKDFGIHPLTLEDVLNCGQRPKIEDYGNYHFLVLKSLSMREGCLELEQISFILGKNYIITLQEVPGDSFEAVRQRIRRGKGMIRKSGADYLCYALVDALVDEFFPVLERFGEQIEELEETVMLQPSPEILQRVHAVKRDLLVLRRTAWPERDTISAFSREESNLIQHETLVFVRDCYDHIIQVIDMIETYRDLTSGLQEAYLSSISNRMNEIMKVLTIISTIFIPLTFIAGIYGMNFDPHVSRWNMPELEWVFGYPFSLGLMGAIAFALIIFFRRKGWL
jgi:magnesium transporter